MTRRCLVGVSFMGLLVGGLASGQSDESRARETAAELVRENLGASASHQLRTTRREDWEDVVFRLQVKIKGRIAKAVFFFEVTESGYFVLSPEESVHIDAVDGERSWVVAVPRSNGSRPYGLFGFPNGEAEFRRLASEAHLQIRSEPDAEAEALLFFATLRDPKQQTIIFRPRELRRRVEDYYASRLPELKAERQISSWWGGFIATKTGERLGIKSNPTSSGFGVSITFVRSQNDRLALSLVDLRISRDGACETAGVSTLYQSK